MSGPPRKEAESQPVTRTPLRDIVADCTKRWLVETLQEAEGGNVEMMVLASQMLAEGYGCEPDTQRARQLYQEACAQAQALQPPASRPKQQQQQQQQAPVQAQTQAQAQR